MFLIELQNNKLREGLKNNEKNKVEFSDGHFPLPIYFRSKWPKIKMIEKVNFNLGQNPEFRS